MRMVNQDIVREEFYASTAAVDGTSEQKQHFKRQRFWRAVNRAQEDRLIGLREINNVTYLWLMPLQPDPDKE